MFEMSQEAIESLTDPVSPAKNHIRFYRKPVVDKTASKDEGRTIHKMVDYIVVMVPGDQSSIVDRPVKLLDRRQYPGQWAAFQQDIDQDAATGTLLSAWGQIPPERVADYAVKHVRTVEQLADISDGNIQAFGPNVARKDRERARQFLEVSKGNAPITKLQAELADKDKRIAAMEFQLEQLLSRSAVAANQPMAADDLEPANEPMVAKRRPGRPRKEA